MLLLQLAFTLLDNAPTLSWPKKCECTRVQIQKLVSKSSMSSTFATKNWIEYLFHFPICIQVVNYFDVNLITCGLSCWFHFHFAFLDCHFRCHNSWVLESTPSKQAINIQGYNKQGTLLLKVLSHRFPTCICIQLPKRESMAENIIKTLISDNEITNFCNLPRKLSCWVKYNNLLNNLIDNPFPQVSSISLCISHNTLE